MSRDDSGELDNDLAGQSDSGEFDESGEGLPGFGESDGDGIDACGTQIDFGQEVYDSVNDDGDCKVAALPAAAVRRRCG